MKKACRLSPCSLIVAVALLAPAAWAQLEITSSPNIVGSGARALGMGSAFIAIADDATAASWNPGGLTQLERPELSLVYNFKYLGEDFDSSTHPELSGDHDVNFNDINYFSFVYPVQRTFGGRNLVFSINYQRKFDFDRDLDLRFTSLGAVGGNIVGTRQNIDYSQRGALGTISPAVGFEITDRLSVGLAVNIWDQSLLPDNEWKIRNYNRVGSFINGGAFPGVRLEVEEDYQNFEGINYTLGLFYRATERLNFGAVYHSKFTADVDFIQTQRIRPGIGALRIRREKEYVFPMAFGLGVAYRFPNDKLTLSFDITRREWDQFIIHDPQNRNLGMQRTSGITGLPVSRSNVDPTYTVRLGGEYVFVDNTKPVQNILPSVRAGIFYDPEPSGGRRSGFFGLNEGDGVPDDYYGITLGVGALIKNRVNLDFAYQYRWGNGVRNDTFGLAGTDADVDQHLFYVSTVIYF